MKIILLSSDANLNITGRITSVLSDSWIRLAEANKENTLPHMTCFRERSHLLFGNIPIIQQLISGPLIYIPSLSSQSETIYQNTTEIRKKSKQNGSNSR